MAFPICLDLPVFPIEDVESPGHGLVSVEVGVQQVQHLPSVFKGQKYIQSFGGRSYSAASRGKELFLKLECLFPRR
jgi:hypothetical protein